MNYKKITKIWKRVPLRDQCLIIFMGIFILQSASTLFLKGMGAYATNIDIIARTTMASIFGYFISSNFMNPGRGIRQGIASKDIQPTVQESSLVKPPVETVIEPLVEAPVETTIEPLVEAPVEMTIEPLVEPQIEGMREPLGEPPVETAVASFASPLRESPQVFQDTPALHVSTEKNIEQVTQPVVRANFNDFDEEIEHKIDNQIQILIITGIGIVSLIILILARRVTDMPQDSLSTISQFRSFVSGCVGFLIGIPPDNDIKK